MKARAVLLLVVAVFLPVLARAGEQAEPETITIAGKTYTVVPDAEMRALGFEFPDVPRDENAAYDYIAAINAYTPFEDRELELLAHRVAGGRTSWNDAPPELREHVQNNQKTLELLRAGTRKARCHFPFVDTAPPGREVPLIFRTYLSPRFSGARQMVGFLGPAGSMHEHDGEYAESLALYADAAALGVHVEQDASIIAFFSGYACAGIGLEHICRCVTGARIDDVHLLETQKLLARVRALRAGCLDVIRWERVHSTRVLEYVFGEEQISCLELDVRSWPNVLVALLLSSPKFQAAMRAGHERFWDALTRYAREPLPDYIRTTTRYLDSKPEQFRAFVADLPCFIALWGLTNRDPIITYRMLYDREDLEWTVTDTFLALARHKGKHGEYPETLDEAKDLMLSDGIDPFSGELLKYRREADGSFTLWSVGEDLVDDGGKHKEGAARWYGPDYVWTSRVESDAE